MKDQIESSGREAEPFRDVAAARPAGEYAGAEVANTGTGNALTAAQLTKWRNGRKRNERLVPRSFSPSLPGIASEVELLWSAYDKFEHIKAEYRVDTIEHRSGLLWRIQTLRLSSVANADQINEHYEAFTLLVSEAASAGAPLADWDKCERFLLSLDHDFESVRIQFRLMPSVERSWRNLVSAYKSLADTRRMKQQRDASIKAIYRASSPPARSSTSFKPKSDDEKKQKGKGKGKHGKGNQKGSGNNKSKCNWCGIPNHTENDCRKKAAGEPSRADFQEAAKQLKHRAERSEVQYSLLRSVSWDLTGPLLGLSVCHRVTSGTAAAAEDIVPRISES